MTGATLLPGFADAVHDTQRAFRAVLHAVSHPGSAVRLSQCPLGPWPLEPGAAAVALTLLDLETPVWLQDDGGAVGDYLRFHCGCPITTDLRQASFAVITDPLEMPGLAEFNPGSAEYPDRSATLILQVPGFTGTRSVRLSGPGIRDHTTLAMSGLSERFWDEVRENHAFYPCGVDLIFVSAHQIVGLPRSIQVEAR